MAGLKTDKAPCHRSIMTGKILNTTTTTKTTATITMITIIPRITLHISSCLTSGALRSQLLFLQIFISLRLVPLHLHLHLHPAPPPWQDQTHPCHSIPSQSHIPGAFP